MKSQLPLTLGPKDCACFESFFPGRNGEVLENLRRAVAAPGEPVLYLWGGSGTGKSHLLQAVCHALGETNAAAFYFPMTLADQIPYEALDGLETMAVVCIDDMEAIAGHRDWELALMRLFVRIHQAGGGLIVAGAAVPAALGIKLTQLSSRLAGGLVFQLQPLSEEDKVQALRLRAARRGFELPMEAGRYLVRHCGANADTLFGALDVLDKASLVAKRKLTLPFIRSVLASS